MLKKAGARIARAWDVGEVNTLVGRSLLEARYRSLQKQIPLLYTVALANFIGLHLATSGRFDTIAQPATILAVAVVLRLIYWFRHRKRELPPERIRTELVKTLVFALLFSVGFCAWGFSLLQGADVQQQTYVVLFGSLAAVGCAYGLSSFPAAARLPLLFLGLPLAATLIVSPEAAHVGAGISLALVTLLIMRLLGVHNKGFASLVESRTIIAAERERARRAEKKAKAEQDKARVSANTDHLTGLGNRRSFLKSLNAKASRLRRTDAGLALAIIDLDGFKPINDTFGHASGDEVLKEVGRRLKMVAGADATVARMGGDEFAILYPDVRDAGAAAELGQRICRSLQEPFKIGGRRFRLSGCCGLAMMNREERDVRQALIQADTALYRAKQSGRAIATIFSPDMEAMNRRRSHIENMLRVPGQQEKLHLLFQPICDLATGRIQSFEALARWDDPVLGTIPPAEFIPIAEQISVISELSNCLLAKAAGEASGWPAAVRLSFNLSAIQLCTVGSARSILAILAERRIKPVQLQVEVTETALLVDFEVARLNLQTLREAGVRIVLDDFGAGHASISYLREMQFDAVKLDGSLLDDSPASRPGRRLLRGVIDLCASLGVPCIAEHIEREEQLALLRELGCDGGQGYLFAPPLPASEAAAYAELTTLHLPDRKHAA